MKNKNKKLTIESFPDEILVNVFSFFNRYELAKSGEVCKKFYAISRDKQLKKEAQWPALDYTALLPGWSQMWNGLFCNNIRILSNQTLISWNKEYRYLDLYSIQKGNRIKQIPIGCEVNCLERLSKHSVVIGSPKGKLEVWDIDTQSCLHQSSVTSKIIAIEKHSKNGFVSATDSILSVWKLGDPEPLQTRTFTEIQYIAAISENEVVVGTYDKLILWNIKEDKVYEKFAGQYQVYSLAKINKNVIVSGGMDRMLRIWDVKSGRMLHILSGHESVVSCVKKLTDSTFVSGSHDGTWRIWNVKTGKCIQTLTPTGSAIYDIHTLPNGDFISKHYLKFILWRFAPLKPVKENNCNSVGDSHELSHHAPSLGKFG